MSYCFECPECGNYQYEKLGSSSEDGPEAEAHCWACDYNGDVGEAPDYDSEPNTPF